MHMMSWAEFIQLGILICCIIDLVRQFMQKK
jgi:hypothetical protein